MNNVRIGTVPYLNARPLVAALVRNPPPGYEVVEAVPSVLAKMLGRGEVACALVSSVVALENPSFRVVNAGAIVSDGPVKSVRLMSRVEPERIRTLALDTSSRTGIVLGQVLLSEKYGIRAGLVPMPPDVPTMLEAADAAVLIGDPAMRASDALERGELPQVSCDIDLGSLWRTVTGLPFVYALWTARETGVSAELAEIMAGSAEWGLKHLDEIADEEAGRAGVSAESSRAYFRDNVRYSLGAREWAGYQRFGELARQNGLLKAPDTRVPRDLK